LAACAIIAAAKKGWDAGRLANLIHRAIWVEEQDISNARTLRRIVSALGHDAAALLKTAREPATLKALDRNTREAQRRGVFGSPFYFLGTEMYWGQDRLDFLEESLARISER